MISRQAALGAVVFFFSASLAAQNGSCADAKRQFSVRGLGTQTCSEYLDASKQNENAGAQYANWLTGFFTAYNWLQPDTYDVVPSSQYKQTGLLSFLDLYCETNPDKRVIDAALALVKVNYEKRDKRKP